VSAMVSAAATDILPEQQLQLAALSDLGFGYACLRDGFALSYCLLTAGSRGDIKRVKSQTKVSNTSRQLFHTPSAGSRSLTGV
jgi:hypothetical protein